MVNCLIYSAFSVPGSYVLCVSFFTIWRCKIGVVHLHFGLSGLYWLMSEWHLIIIGVNRAINHVQQFIESMNIIIRWWAPVALRFWAWIAINEQSVNHSTRLFLFNSWEDYGVWVHMVEEDEQQCNECDNNWSGGNCFFQVAIRIIKRIPNKYSKG